MASLATDPGGLRRIQFKDRDGVRKTLRLGKIPISQARRIAGHVQWLVASQIDSSAPPEETVRWLAGVDDTLRGRLVRVGLAESREKPVAMTIGSAIASFKDRPRWRSLKPATHHNYNHAFGQISGFFGDSTTLADVTEIAAEDFHGHLTEPKPKGAGLSKASANRIACTASMLFHFGVKLREIPFNPFDEVSRGVVPTERTSFIEADVARQVLDALEGTEWRLLFALARWGGLRTPSEQRELRWADVDWERNRFIVRSPKTEHHVGKASRVVPIFPELAPLFDERYEDADDGDEFVLPLARNGDSSMFRQRISRAITRLGLTVWPRLMHNLRSTRQTELEQIYPTYVVCSWLGNSPRIAQRHYLQVTESHFEQAAQKAAQQPLLTAGNGGYAKMTNP